MTDLPTMVTFRNPLSAQVHAGYNDDVPDELSERSVEYFRARERSERAAAKRAKSLAARHVHQQLAAEYASLVRRLQNLRSR